MEYTQFGLNLLLNTPDDKNIKKWLFRVDCYAHQKATKTIEEIESLISSLFITYQNKSLSEFGINPTLENTTNFFKDKIQDLLNKHFWVLTFIEVSVPPRLTYSINLITTNTNNISNNITNNISNNTQTSAPPLKPQQSADGILYDKPYVDNHTKPLQTNNPLYNIMRSTENSVTYSTQIDNEVTKIIKRMSGK